MKNRTLYFDIEAGALRGSGPTAASVYSIGYGTTEEGVAAPLHAKPTPGTVMSKWARKYSWRREAHLTEQEILSKFITTLRSYKEAGYTTLAGWNIGYRPYEEARGFDIPMLIARAKKYEGLEEGMREAISAFRIRDIGQETAYRISFEIGQYKHLVDKGLLHEDLFEQAVGYYKAAQSYQQRFGARSFEDISQYLGENKRVSGWKQEIIAGLKGIPGVAHQVESDVSQLMPLGEMQRVFTGSEDVVRWGRAALLNKLTSSAVDPFQPSKTHFEELLDTARQMERTGGEIYSGFSGAFQREVEKRVSEAGGDLARVRSGFGMGAEQLFKVGGKSSLKKATSLGPSRWKLGLGIGLAALWMSEPLGWFSGKDDNYNTIEGLQEGGQAQVLRRALTDFGSGYRGILTLPKNLQKYLSGVGGLTVYKPGAFFTQISKQIIGSKGRLWEKAKEFSSLAKLSKQMMESTFKAPILINPEAIPKMMKSTGLSRKKTLHNIISHERFHQMIYELGIRKEEFAQLARKTDPKIIEKLQETLPEELRPKSLKTKAEKDWLLGVIGEEYLAYAVGFRAAKRELKLEGGRITKIAKELPQTRLFFSGFDDSYNIIEGLGHKGLSKIMRQALTDFGSGWDALRGLVRAGETFEKMLAGKSFQKALKEAVQIKQLGELGMAGTVYQMASTFRGKKFQFARKIGQIGEFEVEAMKAAQNFVTPSVYSSSPRQIDMELFLGSTIESLKKTEGLERGIESVFRKLHTVGFEHGDPHLRNIMRVKDVTGKDHIGLIDLGAARRISDVGKREAEKDIDIALRLLKAKRQGLSQFEALDPFSSQDIDKINGMPSGGLAAKTNAAHGFSPGHSKVLDWITSLASKIFGKPKWLEGRVVTEIVNPTKIKTFITPIKKSLQREAPNQSYALSASEINRMSSKDFKEYWKAVEEGRKPSSSLISEKPSVTKWALSTKEMNSMSEMEWADYLYKKKAVDLNFVRRTEEIQEKMSSRVGKPSTEDILALLEQDQRRSMQRKLSMAKATREASEISSISAIRGGRNSSKIKS